MRDVVKLMRVGVIGTGVMGGHHVRILDSLPEAELRGFYDPDPTAASSVVERFGCRSFDSVEELAKEIDAAVIAAPTAVHRELGCSLLQSGIHVLMEKPLAASLSDADELVAAAGDAVLAVGHVEFHNPAVEKILSLGLPPGFVEVHRMGVFSPRSLDIDVVLDLMIHDLQILHSLDPSPVVKLHAVGVNVLSSRVDIANVRLELASGCVANLTASRVSAEKIRKFRVFVPQGYFAVDYSEQEVRGYRLESSGDNREIVRADLPIEHQEPLRMELEGFLAACRGEETARIVTGEEGRRALKTALRVVDDMAARRGPTGQ
jgi:predicted dehydrogenase